MGLLLALGRKEAMHVAPILKHLQGILGFTVGRLQHEKHHAEIGVHVARIEAVGFLHDLHAPCGGAVERLPIGVLTVLEALQGLAVDRLARHDPQNKTHIAVEIAPHDPRHG